MPRRPVERATGAPTGATRARAGVPSALALAWLLGLGAASAQADPPRVGDPTPPPPRVPFGAASAHFVFHGDVPIDTARLTWIAEDARARMCAWLGVARTLPGDVIHVWILSDPRLVDRVEAACGVDVPAADASRHAFRGRSHVGAGLILLPAWEGAALDWQLVHEIAHLVLGARTGGTPLVIDEGWAELVPSWLLGTDAEGPERIDARYALYERRLAQAVLARELPSFERLLNAGATQFQDDAARWLWHAASWQLVKTMVESRDPAVRGRFHGFLGEIAAARSVTEALRTTYDVAALESAWRVSVDAISPWRPLFGDWRCENDALIGSCPPGTSACARSAAILDAGEALDLAFTSSGPWPRDTAVGFAFDVRGPGQFVYVEVRPGGSDVVLAERRDGAWVQARGLDLEDRDALASAATGTESRIALGVDPNGTVELRVDGARVARGTLGRAPAGGHVGFVVENCGTADAPPGAAGAAFHAVDLLRGPDREHVAITPDAPRAAHDAEPRPRAPDHPPGTR